MIRHGTSAAQFDMSDTPRHMQECSNPYPEAEILRWSKLERASREPLLPAIDAIFFGASGTQSFPDETARAAFRERWLGRYLEHDPAWFYVAAAHNRDVRGYLAGCLDDPAVTPRFADIGYFTSLAALTAQYPAHLHINLAPNARSHGIGGRLIARFAADATVAGVKGMHVITGHGMRNVGFYLRNGFREAARFAWRGRDLLFLARNLAVQEPPTPPH